MIWLLTPSPPLRTVNKIDRQHKGNWERETGCWREMWEVGGRGAYERKKAWSSTYNSFSTLCDMQWIRLCCRNLEPSTVMLMSLMKFLPTECQWWGLSEGRGWGSLTPQPLPPPRQGYSGLLTLLSPPLSPPPPTTSPHSYLNIHSPVCWTPERSYLNTVLY